MGHESFPGRRFESELKRAFWEFRAEGREEFAAALGEAYVRQARLDPDAVPALEIRLLRRSEWSLLRAPAVLLWAMRRPAAFLRAAPRFAADQVEVRSAVAEGLANAAIIEGCGLDDPRVEAVLALLRNDPDPRIRADAERAAALIGSEPDES
ncbi:MAG: hypothetical protein QM311_00950 [Acidobacteriota bacterium]|nr:hypothetical protein [Acidobacteriota bacterium]